MEQVFFLLLKLKAHFILTSNKIHVCFLDPLPKQWAAFLSANTG